MLRHILRWLSSPRARLPVLAGSVIAVAAIVVADALTGPDVSLVLLYLIPIMAITWVFGRHGGVPAALVCGVAGLFASLLSQADARQGQQLWNATVRTLTFLLVGWLVDSQHRLLREQYSAASIDPLTGAMTRRAFYEEAERNLRWAAREHVPVSLLYADLDGLKHTNDSYGHESGDQMIAHFVHVVRSVLRGTELIARVGGDEFVILLPGINATQAIDVADRIAARLLDDAAGPALSASIGLAVQSGLAKDIEQLVHEADAAMYVAKRRGGASIEPAAESVFDLRQDTPPASDR